MNVHAYPLPHRANAGKLLRLADILRQYRRLLRQWASIQWHHFQGHGAFSKHLTPALDTALPARIRQNARDQVVAALEGWLENRRNEVVRAIACSSLSPEEKTILYRINRGNRKIAEAHPEITRLHRAIRRHVFGRHHKPSFQYANMLLTHGMKLERSKDSCFDYWVRVMTPERGELITIPLKTYPYFEHAAGRRNNAVQLNFDGSTLRSVTLMKTAEAIVANVDTRGPKTVAIDTGLRCLFATSEGDMLGRDWIDKLLWYDSRIGALAAELQRRGLKPNSSPRYRALVAKVRAMIYNETRRCLNRLVELHKPTVMVWERLRFHSPRMSRRMNRLVQNFGKGAIEAGKKELAAQGIEQREVACSYTSQECPSCGNVDKGNRPSQGVFKCKKCGKSGNADVMAAKVVLGRSRDAVLSQPVLRRTDVLEVLTRRHLERWNRAGERGTYVSRGSPAVVAAGGTQSHLLAA